MNNIKKSGIRIPNRVTVKKLSNNQKARIATSNIAIADRCKAVRQSVHNNLIDKIRGLDIIDSAERKEITIDCSNKSMTSSPKDKEAIFKEQFQQYLKRKDEKTAMERNFFAKHPPFYVGGKNVNDSGKKSKIPTYKSCVTPHSKLLQKSNISLKNAKLNAKSASSAIKQFESQNLECQKQINSIANKQEAPLVSCSTFTVNASNDEIPSIDNKHEPTQANCLSNTFSTHDCSKSNASDSNSNDEAVFQKASSANVLPEKAVETIVNVNTNDTKVKIPDAPAVSTTKYILKLESPQNSDLSVQVKFENIFEIRRSNRKTRYTGSFTAMATASDTKRRRSRSIGSRTSIVLTPKYAENVNKTIVSEKCSLENKIRFHSMSDDQLKENCPPPSQSPTDVPIPSLQNRLPAFVESTPNCSYAPSTSKRRKTMTPFELNVDLFKAPEINFNDSYTSPLKAANSILKSGKRSTVSHKTVHFELSASSSISFDPEILEDDGNENILSKSSSPLIVPSNKGKEVSQKDENLISPFLRTRRSIYPAQENLIDL